jgi:hypothetical protein
MHAPPTDRTRSPVAQIAGVQAPQVAGPRPRLHRGRSKVAQAAGPLAVHEQVIGPVNGYFIALAAWEAPQHPGAFVGYYKLSADRPSSYWEVVGQRKGCVPDVLPDSGRALAAAGELGALRAESIPSPTM